MNRSESIYLAEKIAFKFLGLPYKWGGDDSLDGFDCSGFVIEILKSVGKLPFRGDWRARDLYKMFRGNATTRPAKGCLVFWGKNTDEIYHVEFCINDILSIGASGGGSKTVTRKDAAAQNAYIKVRPIRGRGKIAAIVNPFLNY